MPALAGPVVVAAALLALAGAQKVVDPRMTTGALRAMGIRARDAHVRAGAAVELAVGALLLATGHPIAAAAAGTSYLAFAVYVGVALHRGAMVGSCGCFGRADTPPSLAHVIIDLGLAAAALVWAATSPVTPFEGLGDAPWAGVPFVGLALLATALVYLAMTELPRALHEVDRAAAARSLHMPRAAAR